MSKNTIKTNAHKKNMLAALEKSLGIVTMAANLAGIDRTVHYDWLKADLKYKEAVEAISELTLDFAESQLHKQIQNGEITSTIFFLKTKGKKRGYVERQEFTGSDGNDLHLNITRTIITQ